MKITNRHLLREFSRKPACEFCGKRNTHGLDPHHFWVKRGMGGGSRLDVAINLIALCRIPCHHDAEHGKITKETLLKIVSRREKRTEESIIKELTRLRWSIGKEQQTDTWQ
jgi:hypothetical protein